MIALPPGEPTTVSSRILPSNTITGAIELRGRLPGSTRLATGLPAASTGREREIGQLVVEQEAAHHLVAAETALDRRRHRHRIAVAIDDRHVRGALGLVVQSLAEHVAPHSSRAAGRPAARPSSLRHADELRALGEVVAVEQARQRHADEVGVGHVLAAVRVGETVGLGDEVHRVDGVRSHRLHVEALEHRRASSARSSSPDEGMPMPQIVRPRYVAAHGLALLGLVRGEVAGGEEPGVGRVRAHLGDDVVGDGAAVERVGAAGGDRAERGGELGVLDDRADRLAAYRRPGRSTARSPDRSSAPRWRRTSAAKSRGDTAKPCSHSAIAGSKSFAQGSRPFSLVRELEQAQRAGRADRASADHRAAVKPIGWPSGVRNRLPSAAIGAVSRPS